MAVLETIKIVNDETGHKGIINSTDLAEWQAKGYRVMDGAAPEMAAPEGTTTKVTHDFGKHTVKLLKEAADDLGVDYASAGNKPELVKLLDALPDSQKKMLVATLTTD